MAQQSIPNQVEKGDNDATLVCKMYEEARALREPYENDWKMATAYCRPRQYNVWTQGSNPANRGKNSEAKRYAYDSTGANALPKFVSILTRLCTPINMKYQRLEASNAELMKDFSTKVYLSELTDRLFKYRYETRARFIQGSSEVYGSLGLTGVGPMFLGKRKPSLLDPRGGNFYKACRLYDVYYLLDDEGNICVVFRRFWLNARQFKMKFPDATPPRAVANELKKKDPSETTYFEFFHVVQKASDYAPNTIGKNKPWSGRWVSYQDKEFVGEEEREAALQYIVPRLDTDSDEAYSFSPALQALPSMGSLNAMKKTSLKQGQKAVDPPLLAFDDGVLSGGIDVRPNKIIHGGLDSQGRELVKPLQVGNISILEKLIEYERKDVNDSFFVTLFEILVENPEMTATQVLERVAEKASLLAPTMGRLQAEFMGPMTERELVNMEELGLLNDLEIPPALVEARGEYQIGYTSPLAKGMYAEETSGFLRTFQTAVEAAQATQNPSLLYPFNLEVAIPEMAERQSAPARWMNDEKTQAKKAKADAQKANTQMVVENAPGIAGAMKAMSEMNKGQSA